MSRAADWQQSLHPGLLRRLTRPFREPCLLLRTDVARRVLAGVQSFHDRHRLGLEVRRRRGIKAGFARGQVPIVEAVWVHDPWPVVEPRPVGPPLIVVATQIENGERGAGDRRLAESPAPRAVGAIEPSLGERADRIAGLVITSSPATASGRSDPMAAAAVAPAAAPPVVRGAPAGAQR